MPREPETTEAELVEMFGKPVGEVVLTDVEQAEVEWIMRYVETHGHQPGDLTAAERDDLRDHIQRSCTP